MNLKHVPSSAPTAMLDRQERKGRKKEDRIMKKMTINSNNNSSSTGKSQRRMHQ